MRSLTRGGALLAVSAVVATALVTATPATATPTAPARPAGVNVVGMSPNAAVAPATMLANEQTAFNFFVAKGLTETQSAGVIGNLDQESGMDPTVRQGGGGPGRGIAQWSAGGRWDTATGDNVVWYAVQNSQSPTALLLQLQFVWFELTTFPGYGLGPLRSAANITAAVQAFEVHYEGCGSCNESARISYAQQAYSRYATHVQPGAAAVWSGTAYHVFWTASSGSIQHTFSGTTWQTETLGGVLTGAPGATYRPGQIDVFAVSPTHHLYRKSSVASGWTTWAQVASTANWQPGVTAVWNGIDYQVFGHDNSTGHLLLLAGAGSQWHLTDLGGVTTGTPGVAYHAGRYDVFTISPTSGWLYRTSLIGGAWTAWQAVDYVNRYTTVGASALYDGSAYHVYVATRQGGLCQLTFTTQWYGPQALDGQPAGSPAATYHSGLFDVFAPMAGGIERVSYTPTAHWQPGVRIV